MYLNISLSHRSREWDFKSTLESYHTVRNENDKREF